MKSLICSIGLILVGLFSYGQYPIQQNLGSSSTLINIPANGAIRGGLIPIPFADTSAANSSNIKFYDGAIIKTLNPVALWYRYLIGQQWIQILPAGGSSGGSNAWLVGGNTNFLGSAISNEVLGTTTGIAKGIAITTNGVARLTITDAGAWGLGAGLSYGTSGQVLTSQGVGAAPIWTTVAGTGTVTSVGLTMPSAFSVANSPITGAGTLAVTGAGTTSQYIRGDGSLATYTSGFTTADNGLTANTATNVRLGGSALLGNTSILTSAYTLTVNSTSASTINSVNGGGGDGLGAYANGAGNGIYAQSSSGFGISAITSTGSAAANFSATPSATNTTTTVMNVNKFTSGTAANNIGGSIDYYVETDGGSGQLSNQLISKWTTAANATRTSQFIISGVNSGTTQNLLTLAGSGAIGVGTSSDYGTSGYLLKSNGANAAPAWVNPADYLATIYNSDGAVNSDRFVDATSAGVESLFFGKLTEFNTMQWFSGRFELNGSGSTRISGDDSLMLYGNLIHLIDTSVGSSATNGYVWTLVDDTDGEGTWKAPEVTASSTNTLTNKRWTARVGSTTSSATPTINTDNVDIFKITALAVDITDMSANITGTPVDGDILEIQITGTATRNIAWGSLFVSSTVTLPAATSSTATLTVIVQYYTTSSYGNNKYVCVNYF